MLPLITLVRTAGDESYGWAKIHILAWNVDGEGSFYCLCEGNDGELVPQLFGTRGCVGLDGEYYSGDGALILLGDDRGRKFYAPQPPEPLALRAPADAHPVFGAPRIAATLRLLRKALARKDLGARVRKKLRDIASDLAPFADLGLYDGERRAALSRTERELYALMSVSEKDLPRVPRSILANAIQRAQTYSASPPRGAR